MKACGDSALCCDNVMQDCGKVNKRVDQTLVQDKLMLHAFETID